MLDLSGKQYALIYADPPWRISDAKAGVSRSIENQYPTMTLADIQAMPIGNIALPDCLLALWVTRIDWGLDTLRAWGFKYKAEFVWDKKIFGMGGIVRYQHESLLLGSIGKPAINKIHQPSVLSAKRTGHSVKPIAVIEWLDRLMPDKPRIELFARTGYPGWDSWGNDPCYNRFMV